jgi:hypothetical protein
LCKTIKTLPYYFGLDNSIIKTSLLCCIFSLTSWNSTALTRNKNNLPDQFLAGEITLQSTNFLLNQTFNLYSKKEVQDLVLQLIKVPTSVFISSKMEKNCIEYKQFRQYLRKFNFFYRSYYLNKYPNKVSTLSSKQINMLAIRSLFVIHGL